MRIRVLIPVPVPTPKDYNVVNILRVRVRYFLNNFRHPRSRAVDPHSFFADPDPAVFLNDDPDPAA